MLALVGLLAGLLAAPVQGPAAGPVWLTPAGQQGPPSASIQELEARRDALLADDSLDPELRKRVGELYVEALKRLREAEAARARADEFEAARTEAPARLEEVRTELERPRVEPRLEVPWDAPLSEIENGQSLAEAELAKLRDEQVALDQEPARRSERRAQIPRLLAEARRQLDGLAAPSASGQPPVQQEAARELVLAQRAALEAEVRALEQELASYDARASLLDVRRALLGRRVAEAERRVQAWRELAERQRQREARQAESEARAAARLAERVDPLLRDEAEHNAEMAESRSQVVSDLETSVDELERASVRLHEVQGAYSNAQRRVEIAGLTDAIGLLLRRQKSELPSARDYRARAELRRGEITEAELMRLEFEDERDALPTEFDFVEQVLAELPSDAAQDARQTVEAQARELLRARRRYLDQVSSDLRRHLEVLGDLEVAERSLIDVVEEFSGYINARILWIRSGRGVWATDFRPTFDALLWLVSPDSWRQAAGSLLDGATSHPASALIGLLVFTLLFAAQARMRRRIADLGERAARRNCFTIRPTTLTLVLTYLLAAAPATLLWLLGLGLEGDPAASTFSKALGNGLAVSALSYFLIESVRQVARRGGLGQAHFQWPEPLLAELRRSLVWLGLVVVPGTILVTTLDAQPDEEWKHTLGRIGLIVTLAALAVFVHRVLRSLPRQVGSGAAYQWSLRARQTAHVFGVAVPLALAGLSIWGFHFTALELVLRLVASIGLVLAAALVHAFAGRWLLVTYRRLAYEQAKERRRAALEEAAAPTTTEPEIQIEEEAIDLARADQQSRQLLRSLLAVALVVGGWAIWVDVLPALNMLERVSLWTVTTSETQTLADGTTTTVDTPTAITLADVLTSLVVLAITALASKNLPGTLEVTLLQRLPLQQGVRYAITTLSRYAIVLVGAVSAFGALGVSWSKIQWLAAAVSVGLGFGLQEIFANFVSGLIILFERPIRVGDVVTVGDTDGVVSRIQMRATTITDYDRRELIVPNKDFITSRLINWTLSDSITRLVVPVGIAYGSDVAKARDLLLDIARRNACVMDEPAPTAVFMGFGDSFLDLRLRVFMRSRDVWPELVHTLHTSIHEEFGRAGIEIAFPQRDLHLRSAEPLERLLARQPGFSIEEVGPTAGRE